MKKMLEYGIERLRTGEATAMMVPVKKEDRIEWTHQGILTRILRDDKPLYWLGQKVGWTQASAEASCLRHSAVAAGGRSATGEELVVVHLMVVHAPGQIWPEEIAEEGFETLEDLREAFAAAFGQERLWKPAWRVRVGRRTGDGRPEFEKRLRQTIPLEYENEFRGEWD